MKHRPIPGAGSRAAAGLMVLAAALGASRPVGPNPNPPFDSGSGALTVIDKGQPAGVCPLKHTGVGVEITGFLARVTVTQEFVNPLDHPIEAVYTFPLSQRAAVDDMTMHTGSRTIQGKIKRREEARAIFEAARNAGHTASLLDQERPNIFTQSVTNIAPGAKVQIVIRYVETLVYDAGAYEFSLPTVVGPRYRPAHIDGANIKPPVAAKGTRAGHDLSIAVRLDAGVPVDQVLSASHEVDVTRPNPHAALVKLRQQAVLPNRDFVLRYDVAGRKIEDALLTHRGARGGFFTFLLQPPERVAPAEITPKEIVFVLDTSGSMSGFPIDKAKEVIQLALDGLNPRDTFNLITFAGDTHVLFPAPVPATPANVRSAQQFLLSRQGSGGTEMMRAIRAALDPSDQQDHIRIVCFLTDGYVGNDMEIVGEVKRHANARVFSFGIGSSVNRFLLDKMAEEGRGEVEYVALTDDGTAAAKRFHERVRSPLLTDIALEWNGLPVADVYPKRIPDLFTAKPVHITGRYTSAGEGTLRLRGRMAGRDFVRAVRVSFPASAPDHEALGRLWARTRIDHLMSEDWNGMQHGNARPELREAITKLGLDFRLMTQFTSFVAVEETTVVEGGQPRRIEVPVEMPYGVSHDGVFGSRNEEVRMKRARGGMTVAQGIPWPMMNRAPASAASEWPAGMAPPREKVDAPLRALAAKQAALRVKVWLAKAVPAAQLRAAGLAVTSQLGGGKIVLGRIAAADLEKLARLADVLWISEDQPLPQ